LLDREEFITLKNARSPAAPAIRSANRSELLGGSRFQIAHRLQLPRGIIEQFVADAHLSFASDVERDVAHMSSMIFGTAHWICE
jgi:hypothetical protein